MLELSKEGRRVVDALIEGPLAWQSPAELGSAMGLDVEATTDLLADLDADGWLSPWEYGGDVVVTLSAWAAARLGVRLVESGRDERPRWARSGELDPPSPRASGVFRDARAAGLERVVDPSDSPEVAADRAEDLAERAASPSGPRRGAIDPPSPTILVGVGLTPWPGPASGPADGREAACPACGSKRLGPSMYCICCDRWGLDHLLGEGPRSPARSTRDPEADARRRESERRARKLKRRARRVEQTERRRAGKSQKRGAAS